MKEAQQQQARWQQVQDIFADVVDLRGEAQQAALDARCEADPTLRREVLELIEEDRLGNPLLDASLDQTARAVLDFGPLPSLIQTQIGPYRLLELLGEGGMGVVYLAERTDIGGRVAIKLLRDAWLSPMRRQRFRIEQSTLAQLNHPSIARIYDSNTLEDGTPWFVMEYAAGLPLTEYWQNSALAGARLRDCLLLFRRVCEAVQYAHSHAIIHRDLKPSNILVTSEGQVKLLDFGIAKQLNTEESDEANANRTVTGLRMMTLAYAAPEQLAGEAVGVYSDVYALGMLLYELLTGQLPAAHSSVTASGSSSKRDVERPSAIVRRSDAKFSVQLSKAEWADLDVLTLKALEPSIDRRYRTADALIRDVDALLEGRPLEARPNRLTYTVGKFIRRNGRILASVAIVLLLIAGTIFFYTVRLERARNAAVLEAARTRRMQQFTESLFDGGDKSAGPAMELKAIDLLNRGSKEAAGLAADPEMQADMQETLGGIYQKLGKLDLADPLLVAALDTRRKTQGNESKIAGSLVALGMLRKDQGRLEEAETLVRQGMAMSQRTQTEADTQTVRAMVAMGTVLDVRGKYDDALQILQAALILQPRGSDATIQTAENMNELASANFYKGHYDQAESLNLQALEIERRLYGLQHPAVAQVLNNLGAIEEHRGRYAAAEADYRQALAITEAWYGANHPETAANLTALAQEISYQKRDPEAQVLLERALAIQKQVNGPINATVATTLNQLGVLAYDRNEYDTAREYFTKAMDTWKTLYGEQYPPIAVAYSNLGSVCLDEKNYACAEQNYREAIRRFEAVSQESVNSAVGHLKLGRALLREGRFKEAEPETFHGYQYVVKQMAPNSNYVNAARKDLALIYDGLHRPDLAEHYRAELKQANSGTKPR
jgi:eukaryotic-like serine/threonine-protein kinase